MNKALCRFSPVDGFERLTGFTKFQPVPEVTKEEQQQFEKFKCGSERGFKFLFDTHYTPLTYFAYKILGNETSAEDVVEDCFIKLWEHRDRIEKPGSIKSWLYTAVKNACIDLIRKENKERERKKELAYLGDLSEQSILHKMIETEVMHLLFLSKNKLPPKARQVFELFYMDRKSHREIAEQMNISVNTVKNQKARAVRLLKKQFPRFIALLALLEHHRLD